MSNCLECPSSEIYAKDMCRRCYNRAYQKRWRHSFTTGQFVEAAKFATCHKKAKHYAKGLCRKCYDKEAMKEWKREYNAKRYKDRKNKKESKVQESVPYIPAPSANPVPTHRKKYPPGTFATPEDERAFYAWQAGEEDELSSIRGGL
jgi:hypothetical protein